MVDIAKHILAGKAGHFDPLKFKDGYEAALKKLVKKKAAGHSIAAKPPPEDRGNVIDLMEALQQSMKSRSKSRRATTRRKHTRSSGRARKAGEVQRSIVCHHWHWGITKRAPRETPHRPKARAAVARRAPHRAPRLTSLCNCAMRARTRAKRSSMHLRGTLPKEARSIAVYPAAV